MLSTKRGVIEKIRNIVSTPKRGYDRMTTEDYLINIRRSMTNTTPQTGKLPALLEASNKLSLIIFRSWIGL